MLQSLQDDDLKILGRDHSSLQALQTIEEAQRLCPGRVSVDVMFGRPNQSVESWEDELSELLRVCDDHVSLYQLTLERGTQMFKMVQRGEVTVPADDVTAEMYQCARRTLHQEGFLQYEVSNFARNVSPQENHISVSTPKMFSFSLDSLLFFMFLSRIPPPRSNNPFEYNQAAPNFTHSHIS